MATESSTDVLIVGAGPAGLTLALWLAHTGITFRIIDKRPNIPRRGQADGLSPRTMEILEAFGIAQEVTKLWEPAPDEMLWCRDRDDQLVRIQRFSTQPPGDTRWGHGALQQGKVEEIMKQKIMHCSSTSIEYESTLLDITCEDSHVGHHDAFVWSAKVHRATNELAEETISARYVIAADGARSIFRGKMSIGVTGSKGQAVWGVMDIVGTSDFPDFQATSVIRSDIDGAVDFVRREEGMTRMYVELNKTEAGWETLDRDGINPETIISKCRYIMRPYKLEVAECVWWSVFTVAQYISDSMSVANRAFLVGDAVHTHSPLCGAGMNTAVQDAYNLGWKLAGVIQQHLHPQILETYETERKPVAEALLDADKTILALFHVPLGPEAEALLKKGEAVQQYLSGRVIEYADSVMAHGTVLNNMVAGRCVPDMMVQNYLTGRASNIQSWGRSNGSWTLIVWVGDLNHTMKTTQVCTRLIEGVLGHLGVHMNSFLVHCSKWPSIELDQFPSMFSQNTIFFDDREIKQGIVIVRPDNHVGWTGGLEDVLGLELYLVRIFNESL